MGIAVARIAPGKLVTVIDTVNNFLLTPHRDRAAAEAFLYKAIRAHGLPEKITIDQSGINTAAIAHYNKTHEASIGHSPLQIS